MNQIGYFSPQIDPVITNKNGRSRAVRYNRVSLYVIVPDSLKMCYMYISTCNRNESVNKQIQIQNYSDNLDGKRRLIKKHLVHLLLTHAVTVEGCLSQRTLSVPGMTQYL